MERFPLLCFNWNRSSCLRSVPHPEERPENSRAASVTFASSRYLLKMRRLAIAENLLADQDADALAILLAEGEMFGIDVLQLVHQLRLALRISRRKAAHQGEIA